MSSSGIRTFSGRWVDPLDIKETDIDVTDIAHALSNQCRFTGHTRDFYSVAQHSVHVAALCEPKNKLCGLLHDASEAYLVDLARPIKHHSSMEFFRLAEDCIQKVIAKKFKLPFPFPPDVHRADNVSLSTEARDLMGRKEPFPGYPPPEDRPLVPLSPPEAEMLFLRTFADLVINR